MKPEEKKMELKVGFFVMVGVALTLLAVIVLGGKQSLFSATQKYVAHFDRVDGLVPGAKVVMGGLLIGSIHSVNLDSVSRNVKVQFTAEKEYAQWIRKNSTVEIMTQGVLGDKYLSVVAGDPAEPEIPVGGEVTTGASKDISQLFSSSEKLLASLTSAASSLERVLTAFDQNNRAARMFEGVAGTAKNMHEISNGLKAELEGAKIKSSLLHLNSILEKVDHGTGSLGGLINDPALYDDAKALVGQVNRNRIYRNLIRQTIKDNKDRIKD